MSDLILYLSVAVIGYFVGSKLRAKQEITRWTGRIQTFAIIVLIFTMSMSMGSKGEVMEHLNSIGLYAFIMTVVIIFCSVAAITISRKFFKLDKYGNIEGSEVPPEEIAEEEEKAQKDGSMTIIILICVVAGLAFGYFAVDRIFSDMEFFASLAGNLITVGLCILLFFVGFDMGFEGTVIDHFRKSRTAGACFSIYHHGGEPWLALCCAVCSCPSPSGSLLPSARASAGIPLLPGIILKRAW